MTSPFDILQISFRFRITKTELQQQRKMLRGQYPKADRDMVSNWERAQTALALPDGPVTELLRAQGLLERAEKMRPDAEYLMSVMELNELLMQIELGGDEAQKTILKKTIRSMEKNLQLPLKGLEKKYADGSAREEDWNLLIDYYARQKYLRRFSEQLKGKL